MDVRRRTVSVVAIAGLTVAMAASAAAWSGASDQPRSTTPSPVPIAVPIEVGAAPQLAPRATPDLECNGPLRSTLSTLRAYEPEPSDDVPTVEDARIVLEEWARGIEFAPDIVIEFDDSRSAEPEPGQPNRFYGYAADGRFILFVDIVATQNGFDVDRLTACSPAQTIKEPPEDVQRLPIPSLDELLAEEASR